jgi:hypothetical protein
VEHRQAYPRQRLLVVDEAAMLLAHPSGGAFLADVARRARKHYLGLVTIWQKVGDLTGSEHGDTILTNSEMKLLLKQSEEIIDAADARFRFTPSERRFLLGALKGEGLLFARGGRWPIRIDASPAEHRLATTNPRELLTGRVGHSRGLLECHQIKDARTGRPQARWAHYATQGGRHGTSRDQGQLSATGSRGGRRVRLKRLGIAPLAGSVSVSRGSQSSFFIDVERHRFVASAARSTVTLSTSFDCRKTCQRREACAGDGTPAPAASLGGPPPQTSNPATVGQTDARAALVLNTDGALYRDALWRNPRARAYLPERGLRTGSCGLWPRFSGGRSWRRTCASMVG